MRKCSQCGQLYSDEDIFCVNDGMTLESVYNAPNRVVIPLGTDQPTQVIVKPPSQIVPPFAQSPVSRSASLGPANWLYLIIGMLIAIVLAMGIGLFLTQSRNNNGTAQSSNENKDDNRTLSNQNAAAMNKPALNAVSANAANIDPPRNTANVAVNKPSVPVTSRFDRSYEGTLNNDQIEMQLARNGSSLSGKVIPRNRYADISVNGSIDSDGSFVMTEYSDLGATTGIYRGRILPDNTITGSWSKPDGSRSRPLYLRGK